MILDLWRNSHCQMQLISTLNIFIDRQILFLILYE